jgi:uncharacterized protein (TIGR02147 family)
MTEINLFQYLDYREFLRDWFKFRKRANRRFSHRAFARRAGQRSPSTLSDVIEGRRNLTLTTTETFCKAMGLSAEEQVFFTLLVQLDQAKSSEDRNRVYERIAATRRFKEARRIEGEGFRYLSHWYYPAIRELAHCPDFRNDPAWVAKQLRPTITTAQAKKALKELIDMGLLENNDGGIKPCDGTIVTPHEVRGLAAHNYHHGNLKMAVDAIERFRPSERHFCGVTVAVPQVIIPRLKQELSDFQERMLELCNSLEEPDTCVIQLNLNFFPLSAPPEEAL